MYSNVPNIFVLPEVLGDDIIQEVKRISSKYVDEQALTSGDIQGQEQASRSFMERGLEPPDWSDMEKVKIDLHEMDFTDEEDILWRDVMCESISAIGQYRKCNKTVMPLVMEPWLASMINHHCNEANMEWGFDILWPKQAEMLDYSQVGDKFDWHVDTGVVPMLATEMDTHPNVIRKITMIWQLSDGDEYEGADLELTSHMDGYNILEHSKDMLRQKGTVIAFPAYMLHRITPLISGRRESVVSWMNGPAWR